MNISDAWDTMGVPVSAASGSRTSVEIGCWLKSDRAA